MKIIKPITDKNFKDLKDSGQIYFDPFTAIPNNHNPYAKMVCVCGYELLYESENTYRCSGGNHRYIIQDGSIIKDKFGNLLFKIPLDRKPKKP